VWTAWLRWAAAVGAGSVGIEPVSKAYFAVSAAIASELTSSALSLMFLIVSQTLW
jgi:hypothetical protein